MAAYTIPRRRQPIDRDLWEEGGDLNLPTQMQYICITNDDKNFCLLDRLADIPEMAHIVISMLTYEELVNLACVNKKWYKTVVNAPQSVKPLVRSWTLNMHCGIIELHVWEGSISLPMKNIFNMIQHIENNECHVNYEYKYLREEEREEEKESKETVEILQFLVDHRNGLLFNDIYFPYPTFAKIDSSLLSELFSTFKKFTLHFEGKMPILWRQELQNLVLENLSVESFCVVDIQLDVEFVKNVLVQVASGQRPHFFVINDGFENKNDFIQLRRGIDPSQLRHINENMFEIEIPSLDECFIVQQLDAFYDQTDRWLLKMWFPGFDPYMFEYF